MKKLFVLSALFLMMASAYGQEKVIDSTLVKKDYTKTEQTVKIGDITYFVYCYKTGEYFTIRENKKTGRKYWQPLEKSNVTAKNENHQKPQ